MELRSGDVVVTHTVGPEPAWFDVPTTGPGIQVVNNAGTELGPGGFGVDRGFQEPDDGSYDVPIDVFAWCGAAVLLRAEYLDDVGLFDEDLFLYYEDLELAWRGSSRGWRYRYVPTSVAHHVHAASSVSGSAFKRYFDERNHLLVLSRHGAPTDAARAIGRSLLVTASYARRDLIAPMLAGRSPARPGGAGSAPRLGWLRPTIARRTDPPAPRPPDPPLESNLDQALLHGVEHPRDDDVEHLVEGGRRFEPEHVARLLDRRDALLHVVVEGVVAHVAERACRR